MTAQRPNHVHLKARGFYDGELTIDGEPFPYPIRSVSYRLDGGDGSLPTLTVEFEADSITIEHAIPERDRVDRAWDDRIREAFEAAEDGKALVTDGRHADSTIRLVVLPDAEATA